MQYDFSYSYFSGANVTAVINVNNQDIYIDCAGLSYSVNYGSSPIYSYCSELFDAVLRGREMVQGNFILNHTSSKFISELLNDAWTEELGINFSNARTFDFLIKFTSYAKRNILLKDAVIISRGQTIQIDSMNLLEEYSFVAKEMIYTTTERKKSYLEDKEDHKRRRQPFTEPDLFKTIEIQKDLNTNFIINELNDAVNSFDLTVKRPYISGEIMTVYARDGVEYQIARAPDISKLNQDPEVKEKTKKFLNELFFKNISKDNNAKLDLRKQLAYMISLERGNTKNNNNRESLTDEELIEEKAALLWTATNRFFIKKNKMDEIDSDVDDENNLLKTVFDNPGWASYYQKYKDGSYDRVQQTHLDFVDKFLNGEYANQIFVHTNFVHANDNLGSFPSWSLGPDQTSTRYSSFEPVYIGNAVFSMGHDIDAVSALRSKYKDLYPGLYNDENNFTIPYEEREE